MARTDQKMIAGSPFAFDSLDQITGITGLSKRTALDKILGWFMTQTAVTQLEILNGRSAKGPTRDGGVEASPEMIEVYRLALSLMGQDEKTITDAMIFDYAMNRETRALFLARQWHQVKQHKTPAALLAIVQREAKEAEEAVEVPIVGDEPQPIKLPKAPEEGRKMAASTLNSNATITKPPKVQKAPSK